VDLKTKEAYSSMLRNAKIYVKKPHSSKMLLEKFQKISIACRLRNSRSIN
jgi:hypothetical protein